MSIARSIVDSLADYQGPAKEVPAELILLLLLLGLVIFMWDLFDRRSTSIRKATGFDGKTEVISVRGGLYLPSREFYSAELGLASRPDALIKEDGYVIPVDIKPLSTRVRDRHVVPLFIHMKLIEKTEGKRPPYGLLLMGEEKRRVRIKNSEEKQRWIDSLLDEMRSILDGIPAVPAPAKYKCQHCDVCDICEHAAK